MTSNFTFADAVSGSPAYDAGTVRMARSGAYGWTSDSVPRQGALNLNSFIATLVGGTTINVGPGVGIVHGAIAPTTEGVYEAFMNTTWTQALAAASTQDRIDIVYVRVWNNEVDASGFTQFQPVYLQGTPAGTPVEPSIPAGQAGFKICRISVPHSGAAALTQNGVMPYAVAAGGILPYYASTSFSPIVGQVRQRLDRAPTVLPGPLEQYDGSAFQPIVPDGYGRGLVAVQGGTTSTGTACAGTTETLDSVLGTLQFAAVTGRRYRVVMTGLVGNGGANGDTYAVRIRDSGSASAPTNTSTLVAEQEWVAQVAGSGGRGPINLEDSFVAASAGTHTLGFFSVRIAGSNNFTPVSPPTLPRRIYVYDVGNF